MNDNDILLATQNGCNLVLITEEGDFPAGSKVLYYKDKKGNDQSVDLTTLTDATQLFASNTNLNVDWNVSLPNLITGFAMFGRSGILSFSGDLSNITTCGNMFSECQNLTSFSGDLSSLTSCDNMFAESHSMASFSGDLSNLSVGFNMFSACEAMTSFSEALPSLTDGTGMFGYCINLTSFGTNLPNLINGQNMFKKCKLDKASVHRIAESILAKPDGATSGYELTLGIDASLQNDPDIAVDLALIGTTKKWTLTTEWN